MAGTGCAPPRPGGAGAGLPRTVNFITGPSRTGDIEQRIELGAHGPRRLHIVVVDDRQEADGQEAKDGQTQG